MIQEVTPIEKEFLIKSAWQSEQPVRFQGISTTGTGVITAMDRQKVSIKLLETFDNLQFTLFERLTGYFDSHGKTYAFESTIRECKPGQIVLDIPEKLLKSLQRKFVRIKSPKSISASFSLANEEIRLNYPICPEYLSFDDDSQFPKNVSTNLVEFINSFKEQAQKRSSANTIVMFRTQKPTRYEEELISKTGRVLYIPSTSSRLPKNDPYPEGRIITEKMEESFEAPDFFLSGSKFEKLLVDKKIDGIISEIWCPVLYYQYVVGYIYLVNRENTSFDISMIDFVWEFSRLLAFQLKHTGYFRNETQNQSAIVHVPRIVDMSPGGMLIAIPKNEIRTPVKEGSIFKVSIALRDYSFACTAKVLRRFDDRDLYLYGTSFSNLSPEQIMTLYENLYRHPYSPDDPRSHEIKSGLKLNPPFS